MGGGKIGFNQLSFMQKFNYVKNNLNGQAVKTSDIVNEIVKLSQNNTEVNIDDLPEGFKIIRTTPNNVKMNTSGTDISDLPEDVIKFADTLNKLLENISTLPPELKDIFKNVLTEFLNAIILKDVENVYDAPNIPDILEDVENVYDAPNIPDTSEYVENVYDAPNTPPDILETIIENVYDAPDIKENFEKALRGLLPDVTNLSDDVKEALAKLVQAALEKLDQTTGVAIPKASSNNVQTKKTPTEIYHKYGNIVKVYNYAGQLLRTEPYDKATHGTFD